MAHQHHEAEAVHMPSTALCSHHHASALAPWLRHIIAHSGLQQNQQLN
jgi:hypothetical protein